MRTAPAPFEEGASCIHEMENSILRIDPADLGFPERGLFSVRQSRPVGMACIGLESEIREAIPNGEVGDILLQPPTLAGRRPTSMKLCRPARDHFRVPGRKRPAAEISPAAVLIPEERFPLFSGLAAAA